jgi:hypothetical protein
MTGFVAKSVIAAAKSLLEHYGFDLGEQTSEQLLEHWVGAYDPRWIRLAAIEALHQGRYKAVSIEQILALWLRRGQPSYHFDHDFEYLICNNQPQNLLERPARSEATRKLFTHLVSARQPKQQSTLVSDQPPSPRFTGQSESSGQSKVSTEITPAQASPLPPTTGEDQPDHVAPDHVASAVSLLPESILPEAVESDILVDSVAPKPEIDRVIDLAIDNFGTSAPEALAPDLAELDALVAGWASGENASLEATEQELSLLPVEEWDQATPLAATDRIAASDLTPDLTSPTPDPKAPDLLDSELLDIGITEKAPEIPEQEVHEREVHEREVHETDLINLAPNETANIANLVEPEASETLTPTLRTSSLYTPKEIQITKFEPEPKVSDVFNKLRDIARAWHDQQTIQQEQVLE